MKKHRKKILLQIIEKHQILISTMICRTFISDLSPVLATEAISIAE